MTGRRYYAEDRVAVDHLQVCPNCGDLNAADLERCAHCTARLVSCAAAADRARRAKAMRDTFEISFPEAS